MKNKSILKLLSNEESLWTFIYRIVRKFYFPSFKFSKKKKSTCQLNETNNESIETHGTVRLLAVRCMACIWRELSDDDRQVCFFQKIIIMIYEINSFHIYQDWLDKYDIGAMLPFIECVSDPHAKYNLDVHGTAIELLTVRNIICCCCCICFIKRFMIVNLKYRVFRYQ